jgi:hypothetical protein
MMRSIAVAFTSFAVMLAFAPAKAGASGEIVLGSHYGYSGVITKIESGVLFVRSDASLQLRTISPNKADRVGLHDAKVGDRVNILVDSGNILVDVSRTDRFFPDHQFLVGTVRYSDPFWHDIQISTPEGMATYEVDTLAGTKLSGIPEGTPVTLELDADNVMIDIFPSQSR